MYRVREFGFVDLGYPISFERVVLQRVAIKIESGVVVA